MLQGKEIVVGITGGIAAYKAAYLVSRFKKAGAGVTVIMTKMAQEFVTPLTFETLSGRQVITDMVMTPKQWEVEHITLARKADIVVVVPATANVIGKCASGTADDFLTTLLLSTETPVVICPAMNKSMYENTVVQDNIRKLKKRGFLFVSPESGRLACGEEGIGRLAGEESIFETVANILKPHADFAGRKILITAGPTREPIDDIRYISNISSGKMGYALAQAAVERGAEVLLVSGPVTIVPPKGVHFVAVQTANEMYERVISHFADSDIVIGASAVVDSRPVKVAGKIKKGQFKTLLLEENSDILQELGKRKTKQQCLVGFSAEAENLIKNAKAKLKSKNLDLIVANVIKDSFEKDTNKVALISRQGKVQNLPVLPKAKVAKEILDKIRSLC